MMWLKNLTLLHFKNYFSAELNFIPAVNAFVGNNGAGKTNLLDAIHYLCLCKSYFNPIDSQQIKFNEELFLIQGTFEKNTQSDVLSCGVKRNQKKSFKRNKKEYDKLADHIGLYPMVMISPNDVALILDGSEERRKFLDNVISQTDSRYLDRLIAYNKILAQRNALLKQQGHGAGLDETLLQIIDEQLVEAGNLIFEHRQQFLTRFIPLFDQHYRFLSGEAETVQLRYQSQLSAGDFENQLQKARHRDSILERSTVGIHKDELLFEIANQPLKKFGSQGQQKSFLIALKLAQYSYLQQSKGFSPLLLLDDIFDKLDDKRVRKLMEMVSQDTFGQIFVSDTHPERIKRIFEEISAEIKVFVVENGAVAHA